MNLKNISIILSFFLLSVSCNSQTSQALAPQAFQDKINTTPNAVVLDVRTPQEFNSGYIKDAVNINFNDANFNNEVAKLDKNKTYFVYCLSGMRSARAAAYMRSEGFKDVINLEGGMLAWQQNNLPVVNTAVTTDAITIDDFKKMITADTKVLVDYYAPWCAPCIKMKPMLEDLSKQYEGKVKIVRLNIDENKNLAKALNISTIPVLQLFENGKETWNHQGYIEKDELVKQF